MGTEPEESSQSTSSARVDPREVQSKLSEEGSGHTRTTTCVEDSTSYSFDDSHNLLSEAIRVNEPDKRSYIHSPKAAPKSHPPSAMNDDGVYLTPPGPIKSKHRVAVPKSAPAASSEYTSARQGLHNILTGTNFKPPLSNESNHSTATNMERNLLIESGQYAFSGYGRPDEFITPTGGGKRRSWRPKTNSKQQQTFSSRQQKHQSPSFLRASYPFAIRDVRPPLGVNPSSGHSSSTGGASSQQEQEMSPGAGKSPRSFCSSPAQEWYTPDTTASGKVKVQMTMTDKRSGTFPVAPPPLVGAKVMEESSSPSDPPFRRPSSSVSPKQQTKWTSRRLSVDPKDLPPAFQAAHRASLSPAGRGPRGRYSFPQATPPPPPISPSGNRRASTTNIKAPLPVRDYEHLERIRPAPKEKFAPAKLQRKWPPITNTPSGNKASRSKNHLWFLRTLDTILTAPVKDRRHVFEKDEEEDQATAITRSTISTSTTTTTVDLALRLLRDSTSNSDDAVSTTSTHVTTGGGSQLVQKVRELLNEVDPATHDRKEGSLEESPHKTDDADVTGERGGAEEEELTRGERLSKLKVQTSMKIRWGGPTYHTIEGRPLYYDGTYVDENGQELPFAPLIEDRFGASGSHRGGLHAPIWRSIDTLLACPRRSRSFDDWSDDESLYSSDDEQDQVVDEDEKEGTMSASVDTNPEEYAENRTRHHPRPTIWIAPLDGKRDAMNETGDDSTWRVKRVWDEPSIDVHEPEHQVHEDDLMQKVKQLLGVPVDITSAGDVTPNYDAEANSWRMKKVYDVNGEIQVVSGTMKVNENGISSTFAEAARAASRNSLLGVENNGEDIQESTGTGGHDIDVGLGESEESEETAAKSGPEVLLLESSLDEGANDVRSTSAPAIPSPTGMDSPIASSKKKETRKKKGRKSKKDEDAMTLWDLLSPPPVTFFVDNN